MEISSLNTVNLTKTFICQYSNYFARAFVKAEAPKNVLKSQETLCIALNRNFVANILCILKTKHDTFHLNYNCGICLV